MLLEPGDLSVLGLDLCLGIGVVLELLAVLVILRVCVVIGGVELGAHRVERGGIDGVFETSL